MNRGLILKTLYETWAATLVFFLGFAAVEGLLAFAIPSLFAEYGEQFLQLKFVHRIAGSLLGTEISGTFGPDMIQSFPWVHPIALALVWGHAIWFCTRLPAGEIDHGTIDLLLSLPVRRVSVLLSDAVVCMVSGTGLAVMGLIGNGSGNWLANTASGEPMHVSLGIATNLYCMYLGVSGMVYMISAVCDRRGRAVGVSVAVVLASFLVNFLAQFWTPAKAVGFLSVLDYYRPLQVVRDHAWAVGDMILLTSVGLGFWICAALLFRRRDIRTA